MRKTLEKILGWFLAILLVCCAIAAAGSLTRIIARIFMIGWNLP